MLADISSVDAIYIVCGRTDMRKSIDGLCAIIQEQFSMELDHALFLFCGRKCDRIKAILKEPDGIEYYGAAEPPVRCGESHLSGLTEPPHFFIKLLCHCWVQSIYFSHREIFSWVNTFNIDLIGIIRYAIHDGIGKSTFTITDLLVPLTFTELRTKDC